MPTETPSVGGRGFSRIVQLLSNLRSNRARVYKRVYGLLAALLILASVFTAGLFVVYGNGRANAVTTSNLSFQGRLLNASGGLVDDGFYNIQFNLYYQASGGTSLWNETYLVSSTQGVRIKNGYFSANLGSVTAFPGTIDWDQEIWLGMTVRGTGSCVFGSCSPADAEMTPRFKLTAVPYAFKANQAANVKSADTSTVSTSSNAITIQSGNATGATSNSGNISIDSGTATGTTGQLLFGTTNASSILLGRAGVTTTVQGALTVDQNATLNGATTTIGDAQTDTLTVNANANFTGNLTVTAGDTFTNAGSTVFTAISLSDDNNGGVLGSSAAATVDVATTINIAQTTASQTFTLAAPTITTGGRIVYVNNTGSASMTLEGNPIAAGKSASFIWNGTAWVQTISFTSTGVDTIGALDGGTYSANGASISGTTLYLQAATSTHVGLVTTSAQNFAGVKTFDDGLVIAANKSLTVTGGATGTRPASPTEGMVYFDTTTKQLLTYSNGKWQADRSTATKIVAASNSSQALKDSADYVATGTSDQSTINTALTAASGGKVYLAEGTYTLSAAISIPNNTTLSGAGSGTLITLPNSQNGTYKMLTNTDTTTGSGVVIRDLRIDGNKSNQSSGAMDGIYFDSMGGGSGSSARTGGVIENVVVKNIYAGNGIYLNASNNNRVANTLTQGNTTWGGIYLVSSSYNTVVGNIAEGNSNYGIILNTSSNGNTLTGNVVQGNTSYGMYIISSSYATITNNTVIGNGTSGIYLSSSTLSTISGNVVQGNSSSGIIIEASTDNTVTGNTVQSNASRGINLASAANKNTISGNTLTDNGGSTTNQAIFINASDYNNITSNTINDSACTSNCYAIDISNSTSDKNYLSGNRFSGSSANAASINDVGTNTIYDGQQTNSTTSTNSDVTDFRFRGSANSSTAFAVLNSTGSSIFNVNSSTAGVTVSGALASTGGTIDLNASSNNNTNINTGTSTGAVSIGNSAAGAITLQSSGNITIGTSDTTGTLLVVDTKTDVSDPTGINGGIYYNSNSSKFRCYQASAWTDCIGSGSGGVTSVGAIDSQTKQANGAYISGTTIYMQTADATNVGLVSTTTQTFAGNKTFSGTVTVANITPSTNLTIGTSDTTGSLLVFDADTDAAYSAGAATNAATEVDGGIFYSTTNHAFMCGVAGAWETCTGLLYSNTAAGSAVNTCTTACGAVASAPIPANYCKPGRVIHITARGTWGDTTSAPTLSWGFYYGTNSAKASDTLIGAASPAASLAATSQTALPWSINADIICFSTTQMNLTGNITTQTNATATTTNLMNSFAPTTTSSLTTTSAQNLYLFPAFGTSNASNTVTMQQFIVTGY